MSIPIDDGPHAEGKSKLAPVLLNGKTPTSHLDMMADALKAGASPKPWCSSCTPIGAVTKRVVERALIMRDTRDLKYKAIVECHGQREVIDLGLDPSDLSVCAHPAFFQGGKYGIQA